MEGVETLQQALFFKGTKPSALAQGWYFGRPVPAVEFRMALKENVEALLEAA